jgi:hypothetical protein
VRPQRPNFSTVLTPRRAQDVQNLKAEWSNSATDHRAACHHHTIYDFMPFKDKNWVLKNVNVAGNAALGTGVTPYDAAAHVSGTQSTPGPGTVAYVANSPRARYVTAGLGALANAGRNTFPLKPIGNFDISAEQAFCYQGKQVLRYWRPVLYHLQPRAVPWRLYQRHSLAGPSKRPQRLGSKRSAVWKLHGVL